MTIDHSVSNLNNAYSLKANRECSENITLELNKKKVTIEKGEKIIIPMISIQQDPEYFHDPKEFIPERFNHGIKEYRDKVLLFPFGEGLLRILNVLSPKKIIILKF